MSKLFDIVFVNDKPFIVVSSKGELMPLRTYVEKTHIVMIGGEPRSVSEIRDFDLMTDSIEARVDREIRDIVEHWKRKEDDDD